MDLLQKSSTIFVLDTNILLDMGRLPLHSSKLFLTLLQSVQSRLWIPRQVYKEFENNKRKVFGDITNRYTKLKNELQQRKNNFASGLEKTLSNPLNRKYIGIEHLNELLLNEINNISDIIDKYGELEEHKIEEGVAETFKKDLFTFVENSKIGEEISMSERLRILSEGELRYKYQIAPGFKDEKKDENGKDPQRRFGDLFLWKEILALPGQGVFQELTDIVFLTNDQKEDWIVDNEPHPHLIQEFNEKWQDIQMHFMKGADFYRSYSEMNGDFEADVFVKMYGLQNVLNNKNNKEILDENLKKKMREFETSEASEETSEEHTGKSSREYSEEAIEYLGFEIDNQKVLSYNYTDEELTLKYRLQITLNNILYSVDVLMNEAGQIRQFLNTSDYVRKANVDAQVILKYNRDKKKFINDRLEVTDITIETVN